MVSRALPLPLLLALSTPALAAPSVGVLELRAATAADEALAVSLGPPLIQALQAEHPGRVVGFREVRAMLDGAAAAALAGCVDDRCAVDAARALSVDLLVAGTVGRLDDELLLSLSLLEPKSGSVKARASLTAKAGAKDGVVQLAKRSATALFHPEAAKRGDQLLSELRTALVLEGEDEEGKAIPGGGIDACVKQRLLAGGVPLVSAQQVKRIRASFDPATLREGGDALDALTDAYADVILSGVVVYAQQGAKGSVKSWRADLDLQLVKVDSGEIVVAHQGEAIALGVTPAGASRAAAKKLCADVVPALERALGARYERGVRLQVRVEGVADVAAAEAAAAKLRELDGLVARARVRTVAEGAAVIETVTRGVDGVGLALALGGDGRALRVLAAGPSSLRLAHASAASDG